MPPYSLEQQSFLPNAGSFTRAQLAAMNNNTEFHESPTPPPSYTSASPWAPSYDDAGTESASPYLDEDFFLTAEEILDSEPNDIDSFTLFNGTQEAIDWRHEQIVQTAPDDDETIPRSLDHKKAMVKVLFKAFKSVALATDNEGMQKPFKMERHDNARVECLCWMLLEALIHRSTTGPLLSAYDPIKSKETPGINSFAQRFDETVFSLTQQKTICKHLFDAPYMNTFVDDPIRARNRVASNRALNKQKSTIMSKGKLVHHQKVAEKRAREFLPGSISNRIKQRKTGDHTYPRSFPMDNGSHEEEELYEDEFPTSHNTLPRTPSDAQHQSAYPLQSYYGAGNSSLPNSQYTSSPGNSYTIDSVSSQQNHRYADSMTFPVSSSFGGRRDHQVFEDPYVSTEMEHMVYPTFPVVNEAGAQFMDLPQQQYSDQDYSA